MRMVIRFGIFKRCVVRKIRNMRTQNNVAFFAHFQMLLNFLVWHNHADCRIIVSQLQI